MVFFQSSSSLLAIVAAAIVFVLEGPAVCESTLITATDSSKKNLRAAGRKLGYGDGESDDIEIVSSVPQDDPDYDSEDYAEVSEKVVIVTPTNSTAAAETKAEFGFACHTIHDLICDEDVFSTLCTLLYETVPEVGAALDSSDAVWTFFAPMDSAFEAIDDVLSGMRDSELERIFKFHAHEGSVVMPWQLECTERLAMISGDDSRTRCETNDDTGLPDKFQKGNGNYNYGLLPKIEYPSLRTCNGIIHVVNHVMIPAGGKTATDIVDAEVSGMTVDTEDDADETLAPSGNVTSIE